MEQRNKGAGMRMGRSYRGVVLLGFLLLCFAGAVAAQESPSDLRVSQVLVSPTAATAGEVVTATVVVERTGAPLLEDADVDVTWRRRDREEPCGTRVGAFPAGEGSPALEYVVTIPTADLAPGAYEVVAIADPRGVVAETSEANNRLTASLDILPPRAELHPVRAEISPSAPLLWGETAAVVAGVMNTGRADAGPFHVTFAAFPVYCVDERSGERWSIAPSATANAKALYTLRPDDGSRSPQAVGLAALAGALPANAWVVFDEVQVAGLERDGRVDLGGTFATGLPLRQLLTISGARDGAVGTSAVALLSSADMARLESCTTTYALRLTVDDAFGLPDEDPTNNALDLALSVRASALELADLVPTTASFSRAMPLNWDDDVDVEVVVANRGGGVAPASGATAITVSFSYRALGTTLWKALATRTIPRLGIDEETSTETVEATIDASPGQLDLIPGSYELRIVVDEANAIPEKDENNNEIFLGFSVQGIELHPIGIEVSSSTVRQGDSVEVVATIENTGERTLEGFSVGFFLGDTRFATFTYRATTASDPGLEEEDRTRVSGTLSTEDVLPGIYALRVVADPDNRVSELDETNNEIRSTITVLAPAERLAELLVSEVTLEPASPVPAGLSVVATARVRNAGTIDAGRFSVSFSVFRDDGTPWTSGSVDCSGLAPLADGAEACACQALTGLARGAAESVRFALWTNGWPEGRYILRVWVDPPTTGAPDGEVREQDSTNNEMILAFSIGRPVPGAVSAGVNLTVDAIGLQPASVPAGASSVVVLATITNRGTETSAPFVVDVRWLRDGGAAITLARLQLDPLGPSQSTTLKEQVPLAALGWACGSHVLSVVADAMGDQAEADEGDNAAQATVRVDCGPGASFAPDLAVDLTVPSARAGSLTAGCSATAQVTVTNSGSLAAGPFRVELRRGGATLGVEDVAALAAQTALTIHFDLPTSSPATLALTAIADSEGRVAEGSEANNTASLSVTVAMPAASTATKIGGPYRGAVGLVLGDPTSGVIVAGSDDGFLHAFRRGAPPSLLYDVSLDDAAKITGLALDRGTATRTVYATTASGNLHRIALATGARIGTATRVGTTATCVALDAAGTAYVGTDSGVAVVTRSGTVSSAALGAKVIATAVEASGTIIYALTSSTLYAVSTSTLSTLCSAGSFGGEATTLALSPTGVYVGTATGRVIAYAPCTSYGSLGPAMLRSWAVDLSASGGSVTSLGVYPDTAADPIYVALCEGSAGRIVALSSAGRMLWTTAGTAMGCAAGSLTVDRTRGRVSFAETGGTIRAFGDRGEALVVEGALAGLGKQIRSNVVADAWIDASAVGAGAREFFYLGTSDGNLYVVETARGGCP